MTATEVERSPTRYPQTSDLLVLQSADGAFEAYLDESEPIFDAYAARCGADYFRHHGRVEDDVHPAWNRLPLILEAFGAGYRKVVWFDADTLVVDPSHDIFVETPDDIPLLMKRAHIPWDGRETCWNDGVLVANDGPFSCLALGWVWNRRHGAFHPHHHSSMWELNWMNDWCVANPEDVGYLDARWNWMPLDMCYSADEAFVLAWHGMGHEQRWREFSTAVQVLRDGGRPVGAGELAP